jgi:hypothetical protein
VALFEVELRTNCASEYRLTDRQLTVGSVTMIDYRLWLVTETLPPAREQRAESRFVCVELRERSAELRKRSDRLQTRSQALRSRFPE